MKERLYIVFGPEHYNTTGLIRSLGEAGKNPIYISLGGVAKVTSTSKYILKTHFVNNISQGYELLLNEYGSAYRTGMKPFLMTIDDQTQSFIDYRYDELKEKFYFFNAGESGRVNTYMNKYNIVKLAEKKGLKVPDAIICRVGDINHEIMYPVITKAVTPNIKNRKAEVYICRDSTELYKAYENIKSEYVFIQHYIEKKTEYDSLCCSINKGKDVFFGAAIIQNYNIDGYYSPYMRHVPASNAKIKYSIAQMMEEIGYEGLFSVEFIIDKFDQPYFLEINFRNEAFNYSSVVAGMNLSDIWVFGMEHGFFPKNANRLFESFNSMVEPIDYQKRVVERGLDIGNWMKQVMECKCLYYYNKNDMEPFYEMIRNNKMLR